MKKLLLCLMMLGLLLIPTSAMIKDSVYLGADSVIFNTSTFFISQPDSIQYFQSPYEADITQSDGYYYPIVLSLNKYDSSANGTLNAVVTIYHANLTVQEVVNQNITYLSGETYSDSDNDLAIGWVMPLDAVAYVSLTREEGNFTVIKRTAWYKTITTLNKPNLDAMSAALVSVVDWYISILTNIVTPLLNFGLLLWDYLIKWLIAIEVLIFVIRRAVIIGTSFVPKTERGR